MRSLKRSQRPSNHESPAQRRPAKKIRSEGSTKKNPKKRWESEKAFKATDMIYTRPGEKKNARKVRGTCKASTEENQISVKGKRFRRGRGESVATRKAEKRIRSVIDQKACPLDSKDRSERGSKKYIAHSDNKTARREKGRMITGVSPNRSQKIRRGRGHQCSTKENLNKIASPHTMKTRGGAADL